MTDLSPETVERMVALRDVVNRIVNRWPNHIPAALIREARALATGDQ